MADDKQPAPKPAKAPDKKKSRFKPVLGSMVRYVMPGGGKRPAVVVAAWPDGSVNLQVFTDGSNDGPEFSSGIYWATSVKRSDARKPKTWHAEEE